MTVLAVGSQKGGVGKTTVSLNLAYALAQRGWRTLLLDTDPQGAVGFSIHGATAEDKGLTAILEGRSSFEQAVLSTRLERLDLLPMGSHPLAASDGEPLFVADADALGGILHQAKGGYDLVVMDTASGVHGVSHVALSRADYLLVPIQAEPLALRSITQVLEAVARLKETGFNLSLAGFLITMLSSRSDVSLSVAQESWSTLPPELVLNAFVPRDPVFLEASAYGVPLALLSRRPPPVAGVFDQVAAELEPRIGLTKDEEDDGPISLLA
jgi:chromosome partitioning protein